MYKEILFILFTKSHASVSMSSRPITCFPKVQLVDIWCLGGIIALLASSYLAEGGVYM